MVKKDTAISMTISFIFTGLGIAYLGDIKKGITYFAIAVILNILGLWVSGIFSKISILVWIYALYQTYKMAQTNSYM